VEENGRISVCFFTKSSLKKFHTTIKGDLMDTEKIMDNLFKELGVALKAISTAKTVEDKVAYSQIIKNLSESLGVFLDLATTIMEDEIED
jgi:hypothetical protein